MRTSRFRPHPAAEFPHRLHSSSLSYVPRSRLTGGLLIALAVGLLGVIDYLSGPRLSLLVFYLAPIAFAASWFGLRTALGVALLSIALHLLGDFHLGAAYTRHPSVVWNALITLANYMVVAWAFRSLIRLQRELEARVRSRTAALEQAIALGQALQRELLEIGERERQAVGHDLHDGLGQHLTAMAYASQVLAQELEKRDDRAAQAARHLVGLAEEGILQSRHLARGLLLSSIEPGALSRELEELAGNARRSGITCTYETRGPVQDCDVETATHLFRLAQEAMRNAIRHAEAGAIHVRLNADAAGLVLEIVDDGRGLPPPGQRSIGVGLSVMAQRAKLIGGQFTVESPAEGGTRVRCQVPLPAPRAETRA